MTAVLFSDEALAVSFINVGIMWFRQNQFAAAIAQFEQALQHSPDNAYARYNRATALLSLGDYEQGFREYEVAWRLFHWRGFGPVGDDTDRLQQLPMWQGEDDVKLLLYHEMGFGDAIMAMRYLPELKRRAEVTLVIDPCLTRLAQAFEVEIATSVPEDLSDYDARLPLFGVMNALGASIDTIPNAPYISGQEWHRGHNRIGIAWGGRTQTSFTLDSFLAQLDHDGCYLYSLIPGPMPDRVRSLPPGSDFADVASRIAQMDHIVSVDTAAIHLAGAMGHPSAHLLLPYLSDWRWWHSEAWYPQLMTYRQSTPDDWASPFAQLNAALCRTTS